MSIRLRLTLWYAAVLALVLIAFGAAVYAAMRQTLTTHLDNLLLGQLHELDEDFERVKDNKAIADSARHTSHEAPGFEFQVSTIAGKPIFRSAGLGRVGLPVPEFKDGSTLRDRVRTPAKGAFRVISRKVTGPEGPLVIQAASSLAEDDRRLGELLSVLLVLVPLGIVFALGGGYWLARRALAPVDRMRETAEGITATRLDQRITTPEQKDELGRLAATLNGMIARLEHSFSEMQQFTADAAHELRTPLAIIRNEAEVALRTTRDAQDYQRSLENILEETERLTRLSDQLLYLCREDSGLQKGSPQQVQLDELAREVASHMQAVANEKGVTIDLRALQPCAVFADPDRLRRVLFNLLDNAIKYTPAGGNVSMATRVAGAQAQLIVSDTGIGIPAEHLPRVFDRFYRVDQARSGNGQVPTGTGLGLAICRAIVTSHGGTISVAANDAHGTDVTVALRSAGSRQPAMEAKA